MILATTLLSEPGAGMQAVNPTPCTPHPAPYTLHPTPYTRHPYTPQVLPVLVGPPLEGGGFGAFPFHKLPRLSDAPSKCNLTPHPHTLHPTPYTLNPTP